MKSTACWKTEYDRAHDVIEAADLSRPFPVAVIGVLWIAAENCKCRKCTGRPLDFDAYHLEISNCTHWLNGAVNAAFHSTGESRPLPGGIPVKRLSRGTFKLANGEKVYARKARMTPIFTFSAMRRWLTHEDLSHYSVSIRWKYGVPSEHIGFITSPIHVPKMWGRNAFFEYVNRTGYRAPAKGPWTPVVYDGRGDNPTPVWMDEKSADSAVGKPVRSRTIAAWELVRHALGEGK
jgi:hypothetical protein